MGATKTHSNFTGWKREEDSHDRCPAAGEGPGEVEAAAETTHVQPQEALEPRELREGHRSRLSSVPVFVSLSVCVSRKREVDTKPPKASLGLEGSVALGGRRRRAQVAGRGIGRDPRPGAHGAGRRGGERVGRGREERRLG